MTTPPRNGDRQRPRVYGCSCNCLPVLIVLCGIGLIAGFQLATWLAERDNDTVVPLVLAGLLVLIGALGLARQIRSFRRRSS